MKLTFDKEHVRRLVAHAAAAPRHAQSYEEHFNKTPAKPALWLVGDSGIYLMSNGEPGLPRENDQHVAYAKECDPRVLPFETWWDIKQIAFGGDDGAETIPLSTFYELLKLPLDNVYLDVTPSAIKAYVLPKNHTAEAAERLRKTMSKLGSTVQSERARKGWETRRRNEARRDAMS